MEDSSTATLLPGFISFNFYYYLEELDEHPWFFSAIASILVGLSGILPLLIIPIDKTASFKDGPGAATLRILLSFAVGGLLGDVFLHLLPEAWHYEIAGTPVYIAVGGLLGDVFLHLLPEAWHYEIAGTPEGQHVSPKCGLWCLGGMLAFIIVEKLFASSEEEEGETEPNVKQIEIEDIDKLLEVERMNRGKVNGETLCGDNEFTAKHLFDSCVFNNNSKAGGICCSSIYNSNGSIKCGGSRWMGRCLLREAREKATADNKKADKKDVAGYLNLMANSIDNFTHGLAVGGSFLVGFRVGFLTTFAILVHEIPHEVGDFAILLKSGFSRWEAAKAQLATASAGLIGAMTAVMFSGAKNAIEAKTSWITPFTAGGFLHIALVTVLPDLLREPDKWQSLKHLAALLSGVALMHFMTTYFH